MDISEAHPGKFADRWDLKHGGKMKVWDEVKKKVWKGSL